MLMVRLFHKVKICSTTWYCSLWFCADRNIIASNKQQMAIKLQENRMYTKDISHLFISLNMPMSLKTITDISLGHPKLGNRNCQLPKAFAIAPQSQHLTILQPQNQQTKKTTPHHPSTTKSAKQESNPYSQNGGGTNLLCILIVKYLVAVRIMWQAAGQVGNVIVPIPEAIIIITFNCAVMYSCRTPASTHLCVIRPFAPFTTWKLGHSGSRLSSEDY